MPFPSSPEPGQDQRILDLALRLAIVGGALWALLRLIAPFVELGLWTVVTASALFPIWRWFSLRIGAWPAAAAVTFGALAVVLGPIAVLTNSAIRSAEALLARLQAGQLVLPDLPESVRELPIIGDPINSNWELARTNIHELVTRFGPRLIGFGEAAAGPALHFAAAMAIFLAAVALAGALYVPGARLGQDLRRTTGSLLGPRGVRFIDIASGTVRTVARGVLGVAAIQALIMGVGLVVLDVPGAGLLALAALALSALQIGATPVAAVVIVWAWLTRDAGAAALLTVWMTIGAFIDLPLKPALLGSGFGTPRLLIFAGVTMGAVAYGPVGLFVGPVLLAVIWDMLRDAAAERPGGIE